MTPPHEAPMTFREEMRQRMTSLEVEFRLLNQTLSGEDGLPKRVDRLEKKWIRLSVACITLSAVGSLLFPKLGGIVLSFTRLFLH